MTEKITFSSETRALADLIPADYNPRTLTSRQRADLNSSIAKFNFVDPIVINQDNTIIGGHQRIKVMLDRGETEVDVRVPSRLLDEDEEKELNLRLNKNTGDWNWEMLGAFDKDMLKDVGFDSEELDKIFGEDHNAQDDDVPDIPEIAQTCPGDLYLMGQHRLVCGDSTGPQALAQLMAGRKAAMCFTDPPYNINYRGAGGADRREGIMNDKMSKQEFAVFLTQACQQISENCVGGTYICMCPKELDTLKAAWLDAGGRWQSFIIWVKNSFNLSGSDYQPTYEPIMYGWPKATKHHYFVNSRSGADVWEDLRKVKAEYRDGYTTIAFQGYKVRIPGKVDKGQVIKKKQKTDIWRHDKPNKSEEHPTMKPVSLVTEAIRGSSQRGEIILDTFMGSGSTLIAAHKTDRICYGIELDPKYCDVIVKRWEEYTGGKAERVREVSGENQAKEQEHAAV